MNDSVITKEKILQLLPHRDPFLMLDELRDAVPGESGIGIRYISADEYYFKGHFPNNPVMPGVLQVEAMAQTACAIVELEYINSGHPRADVLFRAVDNVKFKKVVLPGDTLEMHVKKISSLRNVFKFVGETYVNGELTCSAVLTALMLPKD